MNLCEHRLQHLLETLVLGPLIEFADKVPANLESVRGESQGGVAEVLFVEFTSAIRELPGLDRLKALGEDGVIPLTMLPAWSLKLIPLVFINL